MHVRFFLSLMMLLGILTTQGSAAENAGSSRSADEIAAHFGVEKVDLQRIEIVAESGSPFASPVQIDGRPYTLDLKPHSVRSEGFVLLVQDQSGVHPAEAPLPQTYRGVVLDSQGEAIAGSGVAASVSQGRLTAIVDLADGDLWFVQPLIAEGLSSDAADHAVYRGSDTIPGEWECGVPHGLVAPHEEGGGRSAKGNELQLAEITIDADFQFYQLNGSSVANTTADIENVMNSVDFVYERDLFLNYAITVIIVRTCCPSDPYSSNDSFTLVSQFRQEWNENFPSTQYPRDVAHLFTGRDITGSIIGRAWDIGTICDVPNSYSFAQSRYTSNFNNRVTLTAHELGHNWGGFHCNQAPYISNPCHIMCSGLGGCAGVGLPNFGPGEAAQIIAFADSLDCLGPAETETTTLPFFDHFPVLPVNIEFWTGVTWADTSTRGINEPSAPRSLNLNGNVVGGDEIRSAIINTSGQTDLVLSYWYEAGGTDDEPEVGDNLIVEYQNSSGQWIQLSQHAGTGAIMSDYVHVTVTLPAAAKHANFRLRFRCTSSEDLGDDDWFVDDVCIGTTAFCAAPFECVVAADCEDGIACTDDVCSSGLCQYSANSGLCDDGILCTTDTCSIADGCEHQPNNAPCDDGIACTNDFCNIFTGCQSAPADNNCDDEDPCTDDVCDLVNGCEHAPNGQCPTGVDLAASDATNALAESMNLSVCRVYATFDQPSYNLLSVGFTDISTDAPAGFYQHPFGEDVAPPAAVCGVFPEVCLDSFVTIGVAQDTGSDMTTLDPDWSSSLFNTAGSTTGGWFNTNPLNTQGHPDGQGQVLIAQFTVAQGYDVSGSLTVYFNDGTVPAPLSFACPVSCPADLNEDGTVNAEDLALLLGAWGANPGHEADLNDDGTIDAADLALLLGAWGPC